MTPDIVIRQFYECLNGRRFADAAHLFDPDARLEYLPLREPLRGQEGSIEFAKRWMEACPDGQLAVAHIEPRGETMCEVDLVATGTHVGKLDLGVYQFRPSRVTIALRLRQLFEFRQRRVVFSSLSFDVHDLIRQVASVDYTTLETRLEAIHVLREELTRARQDASRQRDVCERLGRELDAARQVLRPYFYR